MSKEIESKSLDDGDCVEVARVYPSEPFEIIEYGIILHHQLVEMEDNFYEHLYTVITPRGVDDYWPYEIRLVNS